MCSSIPTLRILLTAALVLLTSACSVLGGTPRIPPLPAEARTGSSSFVLITVRNDTRALAQSAGSTPRGYDGAGDYGLTAAASDTVRALERTYGLKQVSAWPITSLKVHCIVFRVPASTERSVLIARLARDSRVESVQPLNEFTAEAAGADTARDLRQDAARDLAREPSSMPYNDPYAPLQRALRELHVVAAQRASRGAGVRIAIIDTGVDWRHPDLAGRVIAHRNLVDGDEDQFLRDRHGTEVAGVIAAVANNGIGIVGIAPDARVLAYKACWQSIADPARAFCNSFTLAQALETAIQARVDIVNLSLAGPPDPLLARLIRAGERQGMLFTGAVPPATSVGSAPSATGGFPASVPGVLAVESAEDGPGRAGDLLAPGRDILTLVPGGHYDFASGSSLATAEVTGILALMISERRLPATVAAQILSDSARDGEAQDAPALVDACRALSETHGRDACRPGPASIEDVKARAPAAR